MTDLPSTVDVVIVGATLAGWSAGQVLAAAGTDVLVVGVSEPQQADPVTDGIGHYTRGLPEHPWRLVAAIGPTRTSQLYQLSRDMSASWNPSSPAPHLCTDPRDLEECRRSVEALNAIGIPAELLDAHSAQTLSGSSRFLGGMTVPGEVSLPSPAHPVSHAASLAVSAGVRSALSDSVPSIGQDEGGAFVNIGGHRVAADAIIIAENHRIQPVVHWFADKLIPVRETVIALDRTGPPISGRSQFGYVRWNRTPDGVLKLAGCRWTSNHMEVGETEPVPSEAARDALLRFAHDHLQLQPQGEVRCSARIFTATCDGLPILGPMPGDPTLTVCTGFQGFDLALSLECARGVARGLLSGRSNLPEWLSPARFY